MAANGRNPANHLGCFWNEHSWINYKPQLVQKFYHRSCPFACGETCNSGISKALPFGPKKASLPILWQHPTSTLPCRRCRACRLCQPCRLCLLCQGWASQKIDFLYPWTHLLGRPRKTPCWRRSPLKGSMDFDLVYIRLPKLQCVHTQYVTKDNIVYTNIYAHLYIIYRYYRMTVYIHVMHRLYRFTMFFWPNQRLVPWGPKDARCFLGDFQGKGRESWEIFVKFPKRRSRNAEIFGIFLSGCWMDGKGWWKTPFYKGSNSTLWKMLVYNLLTCKMRSKSSGGTLLVVQHHPFW